jgi:hypothetical protein
MSTETRIAIATKRAALIAHREPARAVRLIIEAAPIPLQDAILYVNACRRATRARRAAT